MGAAVRNLIRKWWFWLLTVAALLAIVAVIWGKETAIGLFIGVIVTAIFGPGFILIIYPFEYFGIYDGHANLDHWTDYLTVGLFLRG